MSAFQELKYYFCEQYLSLAIRHARRGRWNEVEATLQQIESLDPSNLEVSLLRARMKYHQGDRQDALDQIEVAASRGGNPEILAAMRRDIFISDYKSFRRVHRIQTILWGRSAQSRPKLRSLNKARRTRKPVPFGTNIEHALLEKSESA